MKMPEDIKVQPEYEQLVTEELLAGFRVALEEGAAMRRVAVIAQQLVKNSRWAYYSRILGSDGKALTDAVEELNSYKDVPDDTA